jgi:hypothetical protein
MEGGRPGEGREFLTTESRRARRGGERRIKESGGRNWIRTSEGVSQEIYSLPPLATWVSYRPCSRGRCLNADRFIDASATEDRKIPRNALDGNISQKRKRRRICMREGGNASGRMRNVGRRREGKRAITEKVAQRPQNRGNWIEDGMTGWLVISQFRAFHRGCGFGVGFVFARSVGRWAGVRARRRSMGGRCAFGGFRV